MAGLYLLKPEMFKLTDEENAAQLKAMKEAGEEADKLAAADQVAGKWQMLSSHGPVDKTDKGFITVACRKKGTPIPSPSISPKTAAPPGMAWGSTRLFPATSSSGLLTERPRRSACVSMKSTAERCRGSGTRGTSTATPRTLGTESLKGPETLDGDFTITAAKSPTTGALLQWHRVVSRIKPLAIVAADDHAKPYSLTWTMGTVKVYGIGIRTGNTLFVSSGAGDDVNIAKFTINNGSMNSDWFKLGSKEMGGAAAMTAN